ncbi:hypothetical protein ACFYZB_21210 [Streptomyces sp. NPDC001852]|uniref:hypothetical protein n=1 Tax=Streptomyces sp. NPDC001852 TaxID=3364619 RepID=UPI00367C7A96
MTGAGAGAADAEALDAAFADAVRRASAGIGALYLLTPDEEQLFLDVLYGAPAEFAAPWVRIPVTAPAPVADAVREDRMVWVATQEETARRYPRTAMVLPYPLALAAAPVSGIRRRGVLLLMWPATRPPYMTQRERGHIMSSCGRLARLLEEAFAHGRFPAPRDLPRTLPAGSGRRAAGPLWPPPTSSSACPAAAALSTWRGTSPT